MWWGEPSVATDARRVMEAYRPDPSEDEDGPFEVECGAVAVVEGPQVDLP